jgi:hypothetical protein
MRRDSDTINTYLSVCIKGGRRYREKNREKKNKGEKQGRPAMLVRLDPAPKKKKK